MTRIAHVAKHDSGGNDDEGAIHHALESLGHTVERLLEARGHMSYRMRADFLLCHHWHDIESLRKVAIPKVFWCFDRIDCPGDAALAARSAKRRAWIEQMTAACDLGFMTDGDWVTQDKSGKLHLLMQGADERVMGTSQQEKTVPILFTGQERGGVLRQTFVAEMRHRWSKDFHHVERGVHGEELKKLIGSAKIVVAPDYPIGPRYWSNRVYLTLGFGGFLLHPYTVGIFHHYDDRCDLVYYRSRAELHDLIRDYLDDYIARASISYSGAIRTAEQHTYRHRCAELVAIVKDRLKL